jgi:hypothetical protein
MATTASRRTKLETAPVPASAGRRAWISRIASPVDANSGRLAANSSRGGISATAIVPVASGGYVTFSGRF